MTKGTSHGSFAASISEILLGKFRSGVVALLGLALAIVPAGFVLAQSTQQQQEQQREEQQREQQQRDEQAREQQQREQQAREQQQREEQQREEQAREQQQREQQAREQQQREEQAREQQQREQQAREQQQREEQQREQAREQQQRDQQAREQQAREQQQQDPQQRDQQLREEQQRNLQTTSIPAHNSSPAAKSPVSGPISATSKGFDESGAVSPKAKPGSASQAQGERTLRSDPQSQSQGRIGQSPDLRHAPCDKEPCSAKPGLRPLRPDPNVKLCNDGSCPVCGPGQSPGKDNSCVPATAVKEAAVPPKPSAVPQACAAGQIWNGIQCAPVGPQQCLPGQTAVGTTCQPDCTIATAGAQGYIDLLRMARIDRDNACTQNPTGQECQQAELTYFTRLTEYRAFLGGVPGTCTLPDPISI